MAVWSNDTTNAVLKILEVLARYEEELSIRKIADYCGLTKSKAHRLLQSLSALNWAYQNADTKNYYIGVAFLSAANEWRMGLDLVKTFDPVLRDIVAQCGQTACLNVLDGEKGVCLHKVESRRSVRIASEIGQEYPLHAGATGKLLLAYAAQPLIEQVLGGVLKEFTPYTVTDRNLLAKQLETVRTYGYSFSVEEIDPGVAAVAIPASGGPDGTTMAITVAGTRFDYDLDAAVWLKILRAKKAEIEAGGELALALGK